MDTKTSAALAKLNKTLSAIAEAMTQLQLDIAKLDARVAAIDSELGALGRRLGREGNANREDENARDLELERAVFGQTGARSLRAKDPEAGGGRTRKPIGDAAKKGPKRKR
jgi:hypothetical protein